MPDWNAVFAPSVPPLELVLRGTQFSVAPTGPHHQGQPRLLVEEGQVHRKVMRRELMTESELMVQLRLQGIEDLSQVRRAYLEPNGMISIIRHTGEPDRPVKPKRL